MTTPGFVPAELCPEVRGVASGTNRLRALAQPLRRARERLRRESVSCSCRTRPLPDWASTCGSEVDADAAPDAEGAHFPAERELVGHVVDDAQDAMDGGDDARAVVAVYARIARGDVANTEINLRVRGQFGKKVEGPARPHV